MKVISLFSGCGGSSLGYQLAGGKILLAVEWDQNAVDTYRLNFPDTPVWHGDIAQLSAEKIFRLTNLKPGELDILDGSPPCQGFSTAGKRILDDPRNSLFQEYVRILKALQPKVLVMENVSGMVKGKMKLVFVEILKALKESGYNVRARLLNAMYFNVPQSRQRMIFIGTRKDLDIKPSHPRPQTRPIPFGKACEGLEIKDWKPITGKWAELWKKTKKGKSLGSVTNDGWFSHRKMAFSDVGSTVLKCSYLLHPSEPRLLDVMELKRISSYPDDYGFPGSYSLNLAQIGNSVPPNFMRAIAEHVRDEILKIS